MSQSHLSDFYAQQSPDEIKNLTLHWVEKMVVGLNLCPFAAPVVKAKTLAVELCDSDDFDPVLRSFLGELSVLVETPAHERSTTLLVLTDLANWPFDKFLELVDEAEALIEQAGCEDLFQIATFHPDYCFDGVEEDDLSNWTNRSPWPMLHLIRQDEMSDALTHYKGVEEIPQRNIDRLEQMGRAGLAQYCPLLTEYGL